MDIVPMEVVIYKFVNIEKFLDLFWIFHFFLVEFGIDAFS